MPQDLRSYLAMIESDYPEQFCRVREPVQPLYDPTAMVMALEKTPSCPILFLDRVPVWSAVDESVRLATEVVRRPASAWAPGLVNGVLGRIRSAVKSMLP